MKKHRKSVNEKLSLNKPKDVVLVNIRILLHLVFTNPHSKNI